jgi:hypothetical protein
MLMKNNREKKVSLVLMLFLAFASIAAFQISHVLADIPHNISIQPWTSGTHTILNITITHGGGAPTSSHYVNTVQVNVSGVVDDITLTPQSTVTFVVQYDMGEITGTPTVQARADCTLHGWSGWTNPQSVPEFPLIALFPVFAVLMAAVLLLHSKLLKPSE